MLMKKDDTVFVLVDVQGKLARLVEKSDYTINNLQGLIRGLQSLDVPIIWLEQYPEGLGETVEELGQYLTKLEPIPKITFSAYKNEQFVESLKSYKRKNVLIAGIETHICVYQTAVHLVDNGYKVQVVEDCVSSRTQFNNDLGIKKMNSLGINSTSVEMALYELLESGDAEQFKEILKIIK